MWVSVYLKEDSWLPKWWEEFQPLPHFADGHCRDTQAQYLTHQQAKAFHLPATQKPVHGAWLAPPSLMELKRKEYLEPKDPQLTWDYWEVQKWETIMVIILQQCAIWAKASLDTFCGAVQELHRHLALVVDKSDWGYNGERNPGRSNEQPHGCCVTETSHVKKNTVADTHSWEAHGIYSTICIWAGRDDTSSRLGSST